MRSKALAFRFMILSINALAWTQSSSPRKIASIAFAPGVDIACSASVTDRDATAKSAPEQILIISCGSRSILKYTTQDALVDLFFNYPHGDRLIARWEGGSHVRFTVFYIDRHGIDAKIVFDKQLEGTPDVVNTPDALLVHSGKRWLSGEATPLPTSTAVYLWNGAGYDNPEIWDWKESMRYEDRFCVLDIKKLSCPVGPPALNPIK